VHSPTDGTREILDALRGEGLPLELFPLEDLGFYQGQRMTQVARSLFARHHPDFVFALDADEFVRADSRGALESTLASIREGAHGLVAWHTYIPTAADDAAAIDPLRRIRHRHAALSSASQHYKLVLGRAFAADPSLVICHGNHALASPDPARDRALAYRRFDAALLAHFPVRSAEQIVSKTLIGWLSHIVIGEHDIGRSNHWRELYQRLKSNPKIDHDALRSLALRYAHNFSAAESEPLTTLIDDPLQVGYEIKHAHLRLTEPLAHVVGFAERLAAEYHALQPRTR
jgi:hypothetical protein